MGDDGGLYIAEDVIPLHRDLLSPRPGLKSSALHTSAPSRNRTITLNFIENRIACERRNSFQRHCALQIP